MRVLSRVHDRYARALFRLARAACGARVGDVQTGKGGSRFALCIRLERLLLRFRDRLTRLLRDPARKFPE